MASLTSYGGLLVVVSDEGPGFDPREIPDTTRAEKLYSTHGRGIYSMRQLMDEVSYRRYFQALIRMLTCLAFRDAGRRTRPGRPRLPEIHR